MPEVSPELEARLQAAAAAFFAQPDAGQPAAAAPPSIADAGAGELPPMAAETEPRRDDTPKAGAPMQPAMNDSRGSRDAGAEMETAKPPVRRSAGGARSFPPRWPFDFDAAVGTWSAGRGGSLGTSEQADADADAGTADPAADGGK